MIGHTLKNGTTIQDAVSLSYEPQLTPTQLKQVVNKNSINTFIHESLPPYALTQFTIASVSAANPLGLITGSWNIDPDKVNPIGKISGLDQMRLEYTFDPAGKMTEVLGKFQGQVFKHHQRYDGFSRKIYEISGDHDRDHDKDDGPAVTTKYDALNQITEILSKTMKEKLTYNEVGNITKIQRENGVVNYSYNEISELISENFLGGGHEEDHGEHDERSENRSYLSHTMKYDNAGNRIFDSLLSWTQILANQVSNDHENIYRADSDGLGALAEIQDKDSAKKEKFVYRVDGKLIGYHKSRHNKTMIANYFLMV